MINALRAIESAATAEVGPQVQCAVGTFDGGELLVLTTDNGFQWTHQHLEGDPPDYLWRVVRRFVGAYRAWFDEQFRELQERDYEQR